MLDGRRATGRARAASQRGGSDFGRSKALSGGGSGGSSFDKELDDEIPF